MVSVFVRKIIINDVIFTPEMRHNFNRLVVAVRIHEGVLSHCLET